MKPIIFNKALLAASILAALGYVGGVSAHEQGGTLGKPAATTHYYQVTCYDDGSGPADHLSIQVKDELPKAKPLVSVLVVTGLQAKNSTDAIDGDAIASPVLNIKGVNGTTYYVFVNKTSTGIETYSLDYHCLTSTNAHTGTDIYPVH
jgi:hypothetical protein